MLRRLALGIALAIAVSATEGRADPWIDCELTYDLQSWAVFYKKASGSGSVRCSNGQQASVRLEARGGGLAFGSSEIVDGFGRFSRLRDISEIFGVYARAEAGAGAGGAAGAQVLTRGDVSLALRGTGRGVEIGFSFGSFRISRS